MATSVPSANSRVINAPQGRVNFIKISEKSQEALRQYLLMSKQLAYRNWNIRDYMRISDIAYAREADYTDEQLKARRANLAGDANKYQNVTIPVVKPQVETAVAYQTSVFLTGVPIFGVDSDPMFEKEAKQLETIIDTQAIKGGWNRHLMMGFRDAEKYNFGVFELDWVKTTFPSISTNISSPNGAKVDQISWEGNVLTRKDPYNCYWDTRYNITEVSRMGEFFGYSELDSRIQLKQFIQATPNIITANIRDALEAPLPAINIGGDSELLSYYIPQISQNRIVVPNTLLSFNWMAWAGLETDSTSIRYQNIYEKAVLYARILPSDFKIDAPSPNTPQLWKFIWINSTVLIYAQPVSYAFDDIPLLAISPNEDGLKYQTKSPVQDTKVFQELTSAMMNSVVAARRRAATDRVLYDPSRVSGTHINSDNPSAKIPVRPAAYGKPLQEAVYAFPYRDDQSAQVLGEIGTILKMSDLLSGSNAARQGQFVKGNKTRQEFESVMQNSSSRDQMKAYLYEAQLFTPLKEMLKINILEKQTPATMYSRELDQAIDIDPVSLRRAALVFKVSDGLIPADKLMGADAAATAFQVIGSSPQIMASYNIGPMFSYLMKVQGANIEEFEKPPEQIAFEQAMAQYQNTVTQIAELAVKSSTADNPVDLSKIKYPDAPKPADYNYVPGTLSPSNSPISQSATVLAQYQSKSGAPPVGTAVADNSSAAPSTGLTGANNPATSATGA